MIKHLANGIIQFLLNALIFALTMPLWAEPIRDADPNDSVTILALSLGIIIALIVSLIVSYFFYKKPAVIQIGLVSMIITLLLLLCVSYSLIFTDDLFLNPLAQILVFSVKFDAVKFWYLVLGLYSLFFTLTSFGVISVE